VSVWKEVVTKLDRRRAPARRTVLLIAVLVLVLAVYLYERSRSPSDIFGENSESVALYAEALETVEEDYVDQESIDPEEQTYGAIKGMLGSLDREGHTRFESPEEVVNNRESYSSTEVGVGIRLEDRGDEVVISSLLQGSPAEEAGVEPGDAMVAVDGESVREENIVETAEKLEGPEGGRVELTVLRDGEESELSLKRVELEVPASSWNLVGGTDMAHLRLGLFSDDSAAELEEAIFEAQEAGAERFVLDLRNNEGGWVGQAEEAAAQFLPAGSVVYVQRDGDGNEEEAVVPGGNEPLDASLVVLVNKGTASSAEILAGALRDNGRAKVVGRATFGAGTVLEERPLRDGSAILLAVAEWLTPNGDAIRGSGIEPDIKAGLEKGQQPRTPDELRGLPEEEVFEEDAQLERAFGVLRRG